MEIKNTVTDEFTDDIKEDFEMDLMFGVINKVGDKIDQVSGLGDSLTDNIIEGEMKRSSVKENHGLFTEKDTLESIDEINSTLNQMQENFNIMIKTSLHNGNFSELKKYTSRFGVLDKDIHYAQYNNICLENAIKKMKEIREAFILTEDIPFSKSLPTIQQEVMNCRFNNGLSLFQIDDVLIEMENKLRLRKSATEEILSEINDDQFAYEAEETNNEELHDPITKKKDSEDKEEHEDLSGTMEETALIECADIVFGLDTLEESCAISEGSIRQFFKNMKYSSKSILGLKVGSERGDYTKIRINLLNKAKKSTKLKDIDFMLNDIKVSEKTFKEIIEKMEEAQKAEKPNADQKYLLKLINNGLTPAKVKEQYKWANGVLKSTLNAKRKELESKGVKK